MSHWWGLNEGFAVLDQDDRQRIEDLTGCIPLLLRPFVSNAGKALNKLEPAIWDDDLLASVRINVLEFARDKLRVENLKR